MKCTNCKRRRTCFNTFKSDGLDRENYASICDEYVPRRKTYTVKSRKYIVSQSAETLTVFVYDEHRGCVVKIIKREDRMTKRELRRFAEEFAKQED